MKKTTLNSSHLSNSNIPNSRICSTTGPVQGSGSDTDATTDTDNPCARNVITQPPTTDDSEEVDSDIECEFFGPGDIEGRDQQGPPVIDTDQDGVPD
jgi:hypothetical protein